MLMIILDGTIVNVALPSIQDDLGFSQSNLAWVVNAYLIPFGGLLLLAGRLGDLLGRKRLFTTGLLVFVGASLLCGLAQSEAMLIGARFLQGIGGAMTSAVILGMIVTMFPEPKEQARAIGVYSFVAAAGGSLGLLLGGILTEVLSWHWIFFVNLPIGAVTAVMARRVLQHEEGLGLHHGADISGAALITGSIMLAVYTVVQVADTGWGSATTLILGAVSLALLAGFITREATAKNPLMPLSVFRSRNVAGANLVQILMVAGLFGMFFMGALYLQRVLGYSAIEVGVAFLPLSIGIGAMSLKWAPQLVNRYGPRPVLIPALTLIAVALLLLSRVSVDGRYVTDLLPSMLMIGIGAGLGFPALMTLAMSGATAEDAGLASGLVNTSQQMGGALGLALLVTLSTTRTDGRLADGASQAVALTDGYQLAFAIGAGLVLLGVLLALTVLEKPKAGRQEQEVREPEPQPAYESA
jgi:EmrB/QacA subfamily drug resistance transporter